MRLSGKTLVKVIVFVLVIGGGITYFMYHAMQSSWAYYYSVDELFAHTAAANSSTVRIAGKVKPATIKREPESMILAFTLEGANAELPVQYKGAVPDNFAEGREVVVEGRLAKDGVFQADMLLTRCESKYNVKVN